MHGALLVPAVVLVLAAALLGWPRGRRLQILFDSGRDLDFADLGEYHHGRPEEVPPVTRPHRNLTGDPYFTDGLRAVLLFERRPAIGAPLPRDRGTELSGRVGRPQPDALEQYYSGSTS
jgi:hypothetical protein